jgi:hypothetical protein
MNSYHEELQSQHVVGVGVGNGVGVGVGNSVGVVDGM